MTAGLILAAGESRRMGSPKALLEFRGETFLDRLIGLFTPHCSPVIVVLGAHAPAIRSGTRLAAQARMVENRNYTDGQFSSMQCGLRALPEGTGRVLFTLVDHPAVSPGTLQALLGATPAALAVPRYDGRRGHPILFAGALVPEFLELPVTATAKDVVTRHAAAIAYIDVDDPGVLADVDDAAAYARLLAGANA